MLTPRCHISFPPREDEAVRPASTHRFTISSGRPSWKSFCASTIGVSTAALNWGCAGSLYTPFAPKSGNKESYWSTPKTQRWLRPEQQSGSLPITKTRGSSWNYNAEGQCRASLLAHPKSPAQILPLQFMKATQSNGGKTRAGYAPLSKKIGQVTHWTCPLQRTGLWVRSLGWKNEPS